MRWKLVLNFAYHESCSNTVGDNYSFWLMAMQMLSSIGTQNTLVSMIRTTSSVVQRDAKFVAFGKAFSMGGN